MDEIICNQCHKSFNKCNCPFDEKMEQQIREERNRAHREHEKYHSYKGKETTTKKLNSIRNGRLLNG